MVHHHSHPVTALTVDNDEVEIVKGESTTVTISGGFVPYTATSDKPSITTSITDDTLTISASAQASAEATVTVVDDNKFKKSKVTIAVTTTDE